MLTFEELETMLYEIVNELPGDLFKELNGGVFLHPEIKLHAESEDYNNLYILGEYHSDPRGLGRYITIYYGSFMRLYANTSPEYQKERLKKVLFHEFTHHLESLAGERELEKKDNIDLWKYKSRKLRVQK